MFKFQFLRIISLGENNAQTDLFPAKNIPDVYSVLIPYKNLNNKQKDPM
jgi:hypothetical protein